MDQLPAEIAELRDLFATAAANTEAADTAQKAALDAFREASNNLDSADANLAHAEQAERVARRDYIAALRKHGYVQTADGPKPAEVTWPDSTAAPKRTRFCVGQGGCGHAEGLHDEELQEGDAGPIGHRCNVRGCPCLGFRAEVADAR